MSARYPEKHDLCECGNRKMVKSVNCKPCATKITGAVRRFLNHNCVECGVRIAKGARWCQPCWRKQNTGENHANWRGGRFVGPNGYVFINTRVLGDPRYLHRHQVAEHTVVMERHLGRDLRPGESVHHKNGIRHDNRIENLELWTSSQPGGQRVVDLLAWARQIIDLYEAESPVLANLAAPPQQTLDAFGPVQAAIILSADRPCCHCGGPIVGRNATAKFCHPECSRIFHAARTKERKTLRTVDA